MELEFPIKIAGWRIKFLFRAEIQLIIHNIALIFLS